MKEEFLHFIWKNELYEKDKLITDSEEPIRIIKPGQHNIHAGPDFLNARIKIGSTEWAGNVEIHTNSANWFRHNHHLDKAYNNVILQVVYNYNKPARNESGARVPTTTLIFNHSLYKHYLGLMQNQKWIPCQEEIKDLDPFIIQYWLESLMIERLQLKTTDIEALLKYYKTSWEEVFYILLARNFGFHVNSLPFEQLAKSIPLAILRKCKSSLLQLEAILFGQAGFLNEKNTNSYYLELQKEYNFLSGKFNLKPIEKYLWKFLRLRPVNFPTVRIAQFASLIFYSNRLFSKLLECNSVQDIMRFFEIRTSDFWNTHYNFNEKSSYRIKMLGKSSQQIILINTIIPLLFLYGKNRNKTIYTERALYFLRKLPVEKNAIIRNWNLLGIETRNSYTGQALLQLKSAYCNKKKCLECQIGNTLIKNAQFAS